MQSAIHTEHGGAFGSGNCDRNGCYARVGGPQAPYNLQALYGKGGQIDSAKPFEVEAAVDGSGSLTITLSQGGKSVTSFDRHMAGNPQASGACKTQPTGMRRLAPYLSAPVAPPHPTAVTHARLCAPRRVTQVYRRAL